MNGAAVKRVVRGEFDQSEAEFAGSIWRNSWEFEERLRPTVIFAACDLSPLLVNSNPPAMSGCLTSHPLMTVITSALARVPPELNGSMLGKGETLSASFANFVQSRSLCQIITSETNERSCGL